MSATSENQRTAPLTRWVILGLGIVEIALLIFIGSLPSTGSLQLISILPFIPVIAMWLLIAQGNFPHQKRTLFYSLTPIAAALVVITVLLGTIVLPGVMTWWIIGAIVSAVPFLVFWYFAPSTSR